MTGSHGDWHESLHDEVSPAGSSDRAFGLWFGALAAAAALLAAWRGRDSAPGWGAVATLFLATAFLAPSFLGPLNRGWHRLALLLSRLTTPIVMGALFFIVLTPAGVTMRWFGKDPLRLRFDRRASSYWLTRPNDNRPISMTRQF